MSVLAHKTFRTLISNVNLRRYLTYGGHHET